MEKIDITIILPVYNEEKTIEKVVGRLLELPIPKEVVVINDGSTDNTGMILKNIPQNKYLRVIEHKKNQGKGAGVRTGINHAQGEYLIIQDGDLEQNPDDIVMMLKLAKEKNITALFGTRILNWDFDFDIRYVANMLFALMTNILFKAHLTDIMTGYKLCRTSVVKELKLRCKGFDIEPEITARLLRHKVRICEVPVSYKPRTIKEGKKIRFRDSFKIVARLLLVKIARI